MPEKNDNEKAEEYYKKSVLNGTDPEILRSMMDSLYKGDDTVLTFED